MKITVLYVGSSLLGPLKAAEKEINRRYEVDLRVATHNFGAPFTDDEWAAIENDVHESAVIFVIHVMDGENAARLLGTLDNSNNQKRAVVVINCMPELMKRTRLGKLNLASFSRKAGKAEGEESDPTSLFRSVASWIGRQAKGNGNGHAKAHGRAQYLKFTNRLPSVLRFVPGAGPLSDVKNYLMMFCYFLQPTPANIRGMLLYAVKHYGQTSLLKNVEIPPPETLPAVGIYHPDAPELFESFKSYETWYRKKASLDSARTVGLLLMRPQIVSNSRKHYDGLIRAIEAQGLSVIPAISTLMDNREACEKFFVQPPAGASETKRARVSQIVSLTGFSFVGGPAMNDSAAAAEYLKELNVPFRAMVSLDTQTIDSWQESFTGLNPVQTGMQVAIPEIDGATESFVFGGIPQRGVEPAPLDDRCLRIARRLNRWNKLQNTNRAELKIALVLYCFPPNRGNLGTAADLDVFESISAVMSDLGREGYRFDGPSDAESIRKMLTDGNANDFQTTANVAYRMKVEEYLNQCSFASDIEKEWGPAPGKLNTFGGELLIHGASLGNVFVGVQPSFGFEGDPMRMLMAKGGAPHHGFAAFYIYIEKIFKADVVIHVGTHGAMEFMPGKQVGLSSECWPDRLIGELPNIYIYSVNNPSEGTIAKRRSYAELISYLTPPIENAGLYKGLASLKELIMDYRGATSATDRERLYEEIRRSSRDLHISNARS